MQVTETLSEGLKREFKVVLPAQDIEQRVTDKLRVVGETARIPGFRQGKIPLALLKSRFGASVRSEVLQEAVNDGSSKAITDNGLRPALQPKIEITSADPGADLAFTVAIELLPEIKPMDFKAIELERLEVTVGEDDVTKEVERRAAQVKRTEPITEARASQKGDVVVIDFAGTIDGKPIPGGKAEGYHLELGSGVFIPGLEDQLIGVKAGEHRSVSARFPDEYPNESLRGKDAQFEVDLKEIRALQPVPIDDELAKQLGQENLEALRGAVRKDLEATYNVVSRSRVKRVLFDKLVDSHDFPLPAGMVDMEFNGIWQQIEQDKAAGRLDPEDAAKSEDDLRADYRSVAERRIRLGLLLSEVGRANNIAVTAEELNRALVAEARRHPGQERRVMEFYSQNPAAADTLRAPILEEKVVDFILEMANVTKRPVSPEEFLKPEAGEKADEGEAKPAKKAAKKTKKAKSDDKSDE
ncbi:MAG: trigger factor [Alphaproteobacteria bacterium]